MHLEDNLRKEFPKTDLKGTPHIVSKISAWKKNFNSLTTMLPRTGVGFNSDGTHKIECNDDQWAQIVVANRNAKFMRHKAWPLWEEWNIIFGKDRADGRFCEDIADGAGAVQKENEAHYESRNDDPSNDYHVSLEDLFEHETTTPVTPAPVPDTQHVESTGETVEHHETPAPKPGKKRKASFTDAGLLEFLGRMHNETNKRLDVISSRIRY